MNAITRSTLFLLFVSIGLEVSGRQPPNVAPPPREATRWLGTPRLICGQEVLGLLALPDGKSVVTASGDRLVVWDLETGRAVQQVDVKLPSKITTIYHLNPRGVLAEGFKPGSVALLGERRLELHGLPLDGDKETVAFPVRAFSRGATLLNSGSSGLSLVAGAGLIQCDEKTRDWARVTLARQSIGKSGESEFLAVSGGGERIAIGGKDGLVNVWDAAAKKELPPVNVKGIVRGVALSRNGKSLAVTFQEPLVLGKSKLKIVSLPEGNEIAAREFEETCQPLTFSPDGTLLAGIAIPHREGFNTHVVLFDAKTGEAIREMRPEQRERLRLVEFTADGKRVLAAGESGIIHHWDVTNGKSLRPAEGNRSTVFAIRFMPDGGVVTTTADRIQAWSAYGRPLEPIDIPDARARRGLLSHDGKTFYTWSANPDAAIRSFDAATGKPSKKYLLGQTPATEVALAPDGKTLFAGIHLRGIQVLDPDSLMERQRLPMKAPDAFAPNYGDGYANAIAFVGDSRMITRDIDNFRLWDIREMRELATIASKSGIALRAQSGIAVSPDGKRFAASVGLLSNAIGIFETGLFQRIRTVPVLRASGDEVTQVVFITNSRLAVGDNRGRVWSIDLASKDSLQMIEGHLGAVSCLAVSPDGKRLASGSTDSSVRILSLR